MIYGDPQIHIDDDHTDRIGIRTLVLSQLWQPSRWPLSLAELDDEKPDVPEVPGGLIFIGEQTRRTPGALRTTWTFEGINGDGKSVTFKDRTNSPDYSFEPGFSQVSIIKHPAWQYLEKTYGGQVIDGQVIWPEYISSSGAASGPVKDRRHGGQTQSAFRARRFFPHGRHLLLPLRLADTRRRDAGDRLYCGHTARLSAAGARRPQLAQGADALAAARADARHHGGLLAERRRRMAHANLWRRGANERWPASAVTPSAYPMWAALPSEIAANFFPDMNWAVFQPPSRHDNVTPDHVPMLARPGEATRLTVNSMGHSTGTPPRGQTFNHSFRPFLGSSSITFRLGVVQSLAGVGPIEPRIKVNGQLVPMSGEDGNTPAPLSLSGVSPGSDGVTWAALEVTPDPATGELLKGALVQIVHTLTPISHSITLGCCALTMILWSGNSPIYAIPVVTFNLRYLRILASAGNPTGAPKHLFL